jgi:hypothetical protein
MALYAGDVTFWEDHYATIEQTAKAADPAEA